MKTFSLLVLAFASLAAAGSSGNDNGSKTLDSSVIQHVDGSPQADGEAQSATSNNNFINFCKGKTLTNGKQVKGGSCNPIPQGNIPSTGHMVSCKFQNPKNLDTIEADKTFTLKLKIKNLATGSFTNAANTYYAAPQDLDSSGLIIGHSHVVIEEIDSLTTTTVSNPSKFAFFKGLNDKAVNGILSVSVDGGLPAGTYRMSSINSSSNHQPVLMPVAQHGSVDDIVYFTVKSNSGSSGGSSSSSEKSASSSSSSSGSSDSGSSNGSSDSGETSSNNLASTSKKCRRRRSEIMTPALVQ